MLLFLFIYFISTVWLNESSKNHLTAKVIFLQDNRSPSQYPRSYPVRDANT